MNAQLKNNLILGGCVLAAAAVIFYYFRGEVAEQLKNDVDGDSYEGQTAEDAIKSDITLNQDQKEIALEEEREKSSLRVEYSRLYTPAGGTTVQAPLGFSLSQLRKYVQIKKQDVLQAAQNLYQQRTNEACPASLTPSNWKDLSATDVLEIVNDIEDAANVIMAKYQDLYFRTTGTKCASGLTVLQIKTEIKAYLSNMQSEVSKYNKEIVEAQNAWNITLNAIRDWANGFAEASYEIKGKHSYSDYYQRLCDEFIDDNDRNKAYRWFYARQAYLTRGYNNKGLKKATIDEMNSYNADKLLARPNQLRAINIRSYIQVQLTSIDLWDDCGYLKTDPNSPKNRYDKALAQYTKASSQK